VQTDSRHISLVRELDPRIDQALGSLSPKDGGLWVIGSELRLQQIITNLASNAVKYTPEGAGPVTVSTRFLDKMPEEEILPGEPPDTDEDGNPVSENENKANHHFPSRDVLTIRIEIQDSGPGSTCFQANTIFLLNLS
jgi:signal transduction histidine kinase